MKEFNFHKVFKTKNYERPNKIITSLSLRASFSKEHNAEIPRYALFNLWNISVWLGMPNHDKVSLELFIYKHKGIKLPRIQLTNYNKKSMEL